MVPDSWFYNFSLEFEPDFNTSEETCPVSKYIDIYRLEHIIMSPVIILLEGIIMSPVRVLE